MDKLNMTLADSLSDRFVMGAGWCNVSIEVCANDLQGADCDIVFDSHGTNMIAGKHPRLCKIAGQKHCKNCPRHLCMYRMLKASSTSTDALS